MSVEALTLEPARRYSNKKIGSQMILNRSSTIRHYKDGLIS